MRRIDRFLTRRGTDPINRAPGVPGQPVSQRWFEITNLADTGVAEIKLRGYIGMPTTERDWYTGEMVASGGAGTLQEFEAELEALGAVKKLQLSIFSEGGDVFTGMAIHNLLVRHPAKKVCKIDGICASAATFPALACGEIQIPSNAWMMIHGSSGCCCGNADDMRAYAALLESVNASIQNLYVTRTGKSAADIAAMLNAETWMDGAKAVNLGFADTVIEPLQNLAARAGTLQPTNRAMIEHAPAAVLALFDMSRITNAPVAPVPVPTAMLKIQTPLMNIAEAPAAGGGAAPAATPPAEVPAVPAAPATPTAPAVPAVPAVPAAPAVPATPTNTAPAGMVMMTQDQVTAMVTTAATNAVAAFAQNQAALAAHNVTNTSLGGAAPVPGVVPPTGGSPAAAPVDTSKMTAMQLINLGRKQIADAGKTTPATAA